MATIWQDLRYGARMLANKPTFSLIAVVTLALGIGATTAIFTVVNAVLLRPLPYPDPDRLVYVGQQFQSGLAGSGEPKFIFWREQSQSFDALAAYSNVGGAGGNLAGGSEAEYVHGSRVSEDFFRAVGVLPALGRAFTKEDDTAGSAHVAILSDALWRRRFAANASLVGQTVLLNDQPVTVAGIMPPDFKFITGADLLVPMKARPDRNYDPNAEVIGRLKPGVTLEQAQTELQVIADKYREAFPRHMQDGESIGVRPYQKFFTGDVSRVLWFLLGAVGFLLLIACANVANLQLARATSRQREISVRLALGASRMRIVQQLLTEGLMLAALGGAAGLLLAAWGTDLLVGFMPNGLLPNLAVISLDWRVLAFTFVAAMFTGVLFGLAPAWQAGKVAVNTVLKETAGKGGTSRRGLRGVLVVMEVALAIILMVGAGLLIRTFAQLLSVNPGFDPSNVLTFQVALNGERYNTTNKTATFYRDALERITRLPGVEAAAITNKLPLDWQFNMPVIFPEQPDKTLSEQFRTISSDYFRVMKISLEQGRVFTDADDAAAPPVAIVNQAFVKRHFDGKDPFAQQLLIGRGLNDQPRLVVGVVGDIKQHGLDRPTPPMVYVPIPQMPDKLMATVRAFTAANFTVRTTVTPLSITAAVKRELAEMDPTLPLSKVSSMEEIASLSIATQRFHMFLLGLFGALGLLLAAVGIYGVMAYSVTQRTNEIGIRIALGAQAGDVISLILRQGFALVLAGTALGLAGAWALTRLMNTLLFGVSATDPLTFVAVSVLFAGVALTACFVPARRAAKVDPMVALRYE